MRIDIDGWGPGYGTGGDPAGAGNGAESSAPLDPEVERPSTDWQPLHPPADVRAPGTVLLVDGIRRLDASAWVTSDDGVTHRALAASYAAGVVRCDLRGGAAEVATYQVERGLFTASPDATDLVTRAGRYIARRVANDDKVESGLQAQMDALEVAVATRARGAADDLLIVDGPLRSGRTQLSDTLGYVKTHPVPYLPAPLSAVVAALGAGERTPIFGMGTKWPRFAWYLRLPGPRGGPWAGIVRVECSRQLTIAAAVALADLSAVTLPRFASTAYKDPRAPQNLVPIAGLERRLRTLLGDPRLMHRCLVQATRLASVPA